MNIQEIDFKGVRNNSKDSLNMKTWPGRGWGRLTKPLQSVKLFDTELESFTMNQYGAIKLKSEGRTPIDFWSVDKTPPESMDFVKSQMFLIPWGQPQILNSCGTYVDMFVVADKLVIDYKTRDKYSSEQYMYQMQFPLSEPNIVEFHYYHCVSGYNTVVGVANTVDDVVSWDVKPNQPYMKKALRIDTSTEKETVIITSPFVPVVSPSEWKTIYKNNKVWVQESI